MNEHTKLIRDILQATGMTWTADELRGLVALSDFHTVRLLYDILRHKPVGIAIRDAHELRLTPAARETLNMFDELTIVSSREVAAAFGLAMPSASNRVSHLEALGLVKRLFSWSPKDGGRRYYYVRAGRTVKPNQLDAFIEHLGTGTVKPVESDA